MENTDFIAPWEDFKISPEGKAFIKKQEGYSARVYRDGSHNRAGGWGHSTLLEVGYKPGKAYWETCFAKDVQSAENCLRRHVHVPLTQNQVDALISLIFNIGCGAFGGSTLVRKLNTRDYLGAAAEFQRWVHADGQISLVLATRRALEQEIFAS